MKIGVPAPVCTLLIEWSCLSQVFLSEQWLLRLLAAAPLTSPWGWAPAPAWGSPPPRPAPAPAAAPPAPDSAWQYRHCTIVFVTEKQNTGNNNSDYSTSEPHLRARLSSSSVRSSPPSPATRLGGGWTGTLPFMSLMLACSTGWTCKIWPNKNTCEFKLFRNHNIQISIITAKSTLHATQNLTPPTHPPTYLAP